MKSGKGSRMRSISIWMERFWLLMAVASMCSVIYFFVTIGFTRQTIQYLIFPFLAGAMYLFRRFFRKRMEGNSNP